MHIYPLSINPRNKDERNYPESGCIYFQETALKSEDGKERKKIRLSFTHRMQFYIKHNQCSSSHPNAVFLQNMQINIFDASETSRDTIFDDSRTTCAPEEVKNAVPADVTRSQTKMPWVVSRLAG